MLSLISRGGMAEIHHARITGQSGFIKDVALKRILPEHCRNDEFVRLFINEARVAARLHHANIVQVFDFGDIAGEYYLSMELVRGMDLRALIKKSVLRNESIEIQTAVHITTQIFKGLSYAHTAVNEHGAPLSIIHRDISPHNLLLSLAGEVKISDFGIAKAAFTTGITAQGFVRGKLGYMSPEQVAGYDLTQKSDIFSVGVVFYELLTGKRLYSGQKGRKLVQQIARAEKPDPADFSHLPSGLVSLLLQMLEKEPENRPTAAEAIHSLQSEGWTADGSFALSSLVHRIQRDIEQKSFPFESRKDTSQATSFDKPAPAHGTAEPTRFPQRPSFGERKTLLISKENQSQESTASIPESAISEMKTVLLASESVVASPSGNTAPETPDPMAHRRKTRWLRPFLLLIVLAALAFFSYGFISYLTSSPRRSIADSSPKDASQSGTLVLPRDRESNIILNGFPVSPGAGRFLHLRSGEYLIERESESGEKKQTRIEIVPGKTVHLY